MPTRSYPATVIEVLNRRMRFRPDVLIALDAFARSGPWQGSLQQRKQKFRKLLADLSAVYGIEPPKLIYGHLDGSRSGKSSYDPTAHRIVLTGKLSVVTVLHEFAHARGMDEHAACRWSLSLFRRCFPRQYSGLIHRGHMLLRPADLSRGER